MYMDEWRTPFLDHLIWAPGHAGVSLRAGIAGGILMMAVE
jgi:hypothetical protein